MYYSLTVDDHQMGSQNELEFLKYSLKHGMISDDFIEFMLVQTYEIYFISSVEDMIRTIEDVTTLKCWKPALYIPGKTVGVNLKRNIFKIVILLHL